MATDGRPVSLFGADPATYQPHWLHRFDRTYSQTNCYVDVLIELLHARGDDPIAALSCAFEIRFEGDQLTFFKPAPDVIRGLYGIDIHEMQPYRPIPVQIAEQIARGRTILIETDSWYLPDTAGISYQQEHVKSSIAVETIDVAGERAHYFHNAGLHQLKGDDFRGAFRVGVPVTATSLPPYAELVSFDAGPRHTGEELRRRSLAVLGDVLERTRDVDPFDGLGAWLTEQLPQLAQDPDGVADVVFATLRMGGAAADLAAAHVDWLFGEAAGSARDGLNRVAGGCAAMSLKLARRKPFDPVPFVERLSADWISSVAGLHTLLT